MKNSLEIEKQNNLKYKSNNHPWRMKLNPRISKIHQFPLLHQPVENNQCASKKSHEVRHNRLLGSRIHCRRSPTLFSVRGFTAHLRRRSRCWRQPVFWMVQYTNNQLLACPAVARLPTDEVEKASPVKTEQGISIFKLVNWIWCIAFLVISGVHYQYRIPLILEIWEKVRWSCNRIKTFNNIENFEGAIIYIKKIEEK